MPFELPYLIIAVINMKRAHTILTCSTANRKGNIATFLIIALGVFWSVGPYI